MANIKNIIKTGSYGIDVTTVLDSTVVTELNKLIKNLDFDIDKFTTYANSKFFLYYPSISQNYIIPVLEYAKKKYALPVECAEYEVFILYVDALAEKLSTSADGSSLAKTEKKVANNT